MPRKSRNVLDKEIERAVNKYYFTCNTEIGRCVFTVTAYDMKTAIEILDKEIRHKGVIKVREQRLH